MAVQFRDYYETLGVPKTATEDEIRSAFRKLARKYHPDVAKDKKAAEEKFKEINEAYEVLSDPEKRKKYDQLGADWNRPGGFQPPPQMARRSNPAADFINGAATAAAGFSSSSTELDSATSSKRFSAAVAVAPRSADLADALRQPNAAPTSKPTSWSHSKKRCTARREPFRCAELVRTRWKSIRSRFHAAFTKGSESVCAGQGEAGARGGKSGDLFLRVRLAKHPDFSVEGSDLIHEVKIEPWRAVLGSELLVPTLEGNVRLKIPPGTQVGQRFRLRERGLPGVSGKRGDLYVVVQINLPKKLTERERETLERTGETARRVELSCRAKSRHL